ncbi:hypothetical protein RQP46_008723 [Phenoliferia psychrophenolica]
MHIVGWTFTLVACLSAVNALGNPSGRNEAGKDFPHSEKGGKTSCKKCGHSATGVELYLTPEKHCFSKCPPGFIGDHNDLGSRRHQLCRACCCDHPELVVIRSDHSLVSFVHGACFDLGRAFDFRGSFIEFGDFIDRRFSSFDCLVRALVRERNVNLIISCCGDDSRFAERVQLLGFGLNHRSCLLKRRGDGISFARVKHLGFQFECGDSSPIRFQHRVRLRGELRVRELGCLRRAHSDHLCRSQVWQAYKLCHIPYQRMHELNLSFRDVSRFASSSVDHLGIDVDFDFNLRVRVSVSHHIDLDDGCDDVVSDPGCLHNILLVSHPNDRNLCCYHNLGYYYYNWLVCPAFDLRNHPVIDMAGHADYSIECFFGNNLRHPDLEVYFRQCYYNSAFWLPGQVNVNFGVI